MQDAELATAPTAAALRQQAESLERGGDWEAAASTYEETFQQALAEGDLPAVVTALRRQGRVRSVQHRFAEAEEVARLSWEIAARCRLKEETAHAINTVAMVYHSQSQLESAEPLYERALELAREVRNDLLIGVVCQNLGVLANVRGAFGLARAWYLESVGSAVRSGDQSISMMTYNNLGIVCCDLREWMEAEIYFSRGIEIAEQLEDAGMLAKLCVNRSEPLIQVGELTQAARTIQRAEEIARRIMDRQVLADAARFQAMMARQKGDLANANRHLSQSLMIAAKAGLKLERAEALEELALVRWQQGKRSEATETAREAGQVYASLGAAAYAKQMDELLEQWETAQFVAGWSLE